MMRIENSAATVLAVFIGALVAGMVADINILIPAFFFACIVAFLIVTGGFVINDYYDKEIDKINNPQRPIPSGKIKAEKAIGFGYILLASGVILSILTLPFITFYIAGSSALLLILYSFILKRKHTIIGNFVTSYSTAITYVFGWSCILSVLTNKIFLTLLFMFTISFLACLGREFIKSIQDYKGDSEKNVINIAVKFGPKKAAFFTLGVLMIAFILTPIPYIYNIFNIFYLIIMTSVVIIAIILGIKLLINVNKMGVGKSLFDYAKKTKEKYLILMLIGIISFGIGLISIP